MAGHSHHGSKLPSNQSGIVTPFPVGIANRFRGKKTVSKQNLG
jgi:hypothetical protein